MTGKRVEITVSLDPEAYRFAAVRAKNERWNRQETIRRSSQDAVRTRVGVNEGDFDEAVDDESTDEIKDCVTALMYDYFELARV